LLGALLTERASLLRGNTRALPLLLKVSPDLDEEAITQVANVVRKLSLDGIIATNTTLARFSAQDASRKQQGGLSGAPLHPLALRVVAEFRARLGPSVAIIGVGGVDSAASALALCSAGADLVQIYTGLIYRGPKLIKDCARALASVGPKEHEPR
jgi:dihydroorotate dehydrogenase